VKISNGTSSLIYRERRVDNWEHRSSKMRCGSCMWFVEKKKMRRIGKPGGECRPDGDKDREEPMVMGRCRKHAPTMTGYPVVFDSDWCGDHKMDETKL
jgi:hypothetical protein